MNYTDWLQRVPPEITGDPLWSMKVYQLALFVGDVAWWDVSKLAQDRRAWEMADQLYRAVGSVSANVAEGYSKGSGKDQARYYEYALGSARETRDWYYKSRHLLTEEVALHRMRLCVQIIRQLLAIIPRSRLHKISEDAALYDADTPDLLLADIPFPPSTP